MYGKIHIDHLLKALFLLGLFLFALIAQGIHQLDNPVKAHKACGTVENHFHQDSQNHSCDLCDYKVNVEAAFSKAYPPPSRISTIYPNWYQNILPAQYFCFLQRGPPQA